MLTISSSLKDLKKRSHVGQLYMSNSFTNDDKQTPRTLSLEDIHPLLVLRDNKRFTGLKLQFAHTVKRVYYTFSYNMGNFEEITL